MKTTTIRQTVSIKASPKEIYEALVDEKKHAKLTESETRIERKVGGEFSAYDGYNTGKILELIPDEKIVIALRHDENDWPEDYFSTVTFEMKDGKEGTRLVFTQTGLPIQHAGHINDGWKEHYWKPMKVMMAKQHPTRSASGRRS